MTLCDRLRSRADFKRAVQITIKIAAELCGEGGQEQKAVEKGWTKVGVEF